MLTLINVLAQLFVFLVGVGILVIAVVYVLDRVQKKHAIRRNFPVIGRFRYWFEHLGEFFRQYFFATLPMINRFFFISFSSASKNYYDFFLKLFFQSN